MDRTYNFDIEVLAFSEEDIPFILKTLFVISSTYIIPWDIINMIKRLYIGLCRDHMLQIIYPTLLCPCDEFKCMTYWYKICRTTPVNIYSVIQHCCIDDCHNIVLSGLTGFFCDGCYLFYCLYCSNKDTTDGQGSRKYCKYCKVTGICSDEDDVF